MAHSDWAQPADITQGLTAVKRVQGPAIDIVVRLQGLCKERQMPCSKVYSSGGGD